MLLYLIGIDHKRTPIEIREEAYRQRRKVLEFWNGFPAQDVHILSTCNRFEIYGVSESISGTLSGIAGFRRSFGELFERSYLRFGKTDVRRHLLRLACGLESQVPGEAEILSQLENWPEKIPLHNELLQLLKEAISAARNIRREAGLDLHGANITDVILGDISDLTKKTEQVKVVVVGTGMIAESFAKKAKGRFRIDFVAHKHYLKAKELAGENGGRAFGLGEFSEGILDADAVISATSSPHTVLKKEHFKDAAFRGRPLYVYDIAVPRDIEPEVGFMKNIILKDLDVIKRLFIKDNAGKEDLIRRAECLLEEESHEEGILYA